MKMYYTDDILEEVRSNNDIVDVISSYIKIQKKGANYQGLCPFHNEKTPSFTVSSNKQIFYCFGCHTGGNVKRKFWKQRSQRQWTRYWGERKQG